MKKNKIRLTESVLRKIVRESVERMLKESKGKQKLQNSFKSKEDMTQYRDMYAPDTITTNVDYYGRTYHNEYEHGNGDWGTGPYKNYHHHKLINGGYNCYGGDEYNAEASRYNNALDKRLATKGGQMSYDWDNMKRKHEEDIRVQKNALNSLKRRHDFIYQGGDGMDYLRDEWFKYYPDYTDEFWNEVTGNPKERAEKAISNPW